MVEFDHSVVLGDGLGKVEIVLLNLGTWTFNKCSPEMTVTGCSIEHGPGIAVIGYVSHV